MEIDHIAIVVGNISDAIDWYAKLFPLRVLYQDETWGLVEAFDLSVKIAFVIKSEHPNHIGISVDEFPEWADKRSFHRDGSEYHYKSDPWGNTWEWIKYPII